MKQFSFENKILTLQVGKSPVAVRITLFILVLICFLGPLCSLVTSIFNGSGVHFGALIFIGIFWLMGFYLLRLFLWNSYGKETFTFTGNDLSYEADYGWFKDAKKPLDARSISFSYETVGYEEEGKGVLVADDGKTKVASVVKMPLGDLEKMLAELEKTARVKDGGIV